MCEIVPIQGWRKKNRVNKTERWKKSKMCRWREKFLFIIYFMFSLEAGFIYLPVHWYLFSFSIQLNFH